MKAAAPPRPHDVAIPWPYRISRRRRFRRWPRVPHAALGQPVGRTDRRRARRAEADLRVRGRDVLDVVERVGLREFVRPVAVVGDAFLPQRQSPGRDELEPIREERVRDEAARVQRPRPVRF